jgi:hypothetical protein
MAHVSIDCRVPLKVVNKIDALFTRYLPPPKKC